MSAMALYLAPALDVADKRVGRPKKEKRGVGRPKGEATVMKEYRARMLNSPKSKKVLNAIFDAALDDEHKHQAAAWKLIVDRIAPVSSFTESSGKKEGGIEIVISGLSATAKPIEPSIEADFTEIDDD